MQTLPTWVSGWGFSLDVTRKLVRRRPELRELGQVFGAVRLYTTAEAEKIRAAVEEHTNAKRPVAVA